MEIWGNISSYKKVSGLLLSCKGENSGFLSSRCGVMGPHLALRRDLVVFLDLHREGQGSSRVSTGIWGNLSRCKKEVKPLFEF